MSPRRRGRRRSQKVGLRRVDAAIDALRPLGFSADLVRKTVKDLLKVYEGDAGWVFIEEASYKLLIETILEEQEKCLVKKDDSSEDGVSASDIAEPSGARNSSDDLGVGLTCANPETTELIKETDEGGPLCWKDTSCLDLNFGQKEKDVVLKNRDHDNRDPSLGSTREVKTGKEHGEYNKTEPICSPLPNRRKPCYGWISSDEEVDIVILRADDSLRLPLMTGRKRKARWDVKPEDT